MDTEGPKQSTKQGQNPPMINTSEIDNAQYFFQDAVPHLMFYDRHANIWPHWCNKAWHTQCGIDANDNCIGLGSWYNCTPHDYMDEGPDLPQGHAD
jgi:hypothetical protein